MPSLNAFIESLNGRFPGLRLTRRTDPRRARHGVRTGPQPKHSPVIGWGDPKAKSVKNFCSR